MNALLAELIAERWPNRAVVAAEAPTRTRRDRGVVWVPRELVVQRCRELLAAALAPRRKAT